MSAKGLITLQFKNMKAAPFDTVEARKRMYDAIVALPGVSVEERLTGVISRFSLDHGRQRRAVHQNFG